MNPSKKLKEAEAEESLSKEIRECSEYNEKKRKKQKTND